MRQGFYGIRLHFVGVSVKITVNTSRRMKWAMHVARIGEKKNIYNILVWRHENKRRMLRTDLTETGSEGVQWINLAKDRARDGWL